MNRVWRKKTAQFAAVCVMCVIFAASCTSAASTPVPDEPVVPGGGGVNLAKDHKVGWNLGNTFDAWTNGVSSETAWGNPKTTQDLIKAVAAAGFTYLRIPITWMGHIGNAPDYEISTSWLDRIAQVANWAHEAGMTVEINIHHDGADSAHWLSIAKCRASAEGKKEVEDEFAAVWKNIATYFKDYGDWLIFEPFNEIHPSSSDWSDGNKQLWDITNEWTQIFVNTVRATGGQNANRWLVIPSYCTHWNLLVNGNSFVLPKDSAQGRLIVNFHCYDPYNFCGEDTLHKWGSDLIPGISSETGGQSQQNYFKKMATQLKTAFIDNGIPVFVDEYGAVQRKDSSCEKYRVYYMEYVTKVFVDAGIVPFYWDNGSTTIGSEPFSLFNRYTAKPSDKGQAVIDAIMRAATGSYTLDQVPLP